MYHIVKRYISVSAAMEKGLYVVYDDVKHCELEPKSIEELQVFYAQTQKHLMTFCVKECIVALQSGAINNIPVYNIINNQRINKNRYIVLYKTEVLGQPILYTLYDTQKAVEQTKTEQELINYVKNNVMHAICNMYVKTLYNQDVMCCRKGEILCYKTKNNVTSTHKNFIYTKPGTVVGIQDTIRCSTVFEIPVDVTVLDINVLTPKVLEQLKNVKVLHINNNLVQLSGILLQNMVNLKEIRIDSYNKHFEIHNNATVLYNKETKSIVFYLEPPKTLCVTSLIQPYAFPLHTSIDEVKIMPNVTIQKREFDGVSIKDCVIVGLPIVHAGAFCGCSISELILQSELTEIELQHFFAIDNWYCLEDLKQGTYAQTRLYKTKIKCNYSTVQKIKRINNKIQCEVYNG